MRRILFILLCACTATLLQAQPPADAGDRPVAAPGNRLLNEHFDNVAAGALPTGWQSTASGGGGSWTLTTDVGATIPDIAPIAPASGSGMYAGVNGYFNNGLPNDAWLFSRGMNLIAGKSYVIRFAAYATGLFEAEQIDVYIGAEPSAAGMTTHLWNSVMAGKTKVFTDLYYDNPDRWETYSVPFTPLYTGVYYLGFYDHSTYNGACIAGIDDVAVTEMYTHNLRLSVDAFSQIPASQVAAVATVENAGVAEQTHVTLSAALNGTPAGSTSIASLAFGETSDELAVVMPPYPAGFTMGANTFTYAVTADQPEETPDDNSATVAFTGTEVVYAYDQVTSFTNGYGSYTPVSFGVVFPIYNPATLTAAGVGFAAGAPLPYTLSLFKMTGETTFDPADLFVTQPAATRTAVGMAYIPVPETPLEAGQRYLLTVNQPSDAPLSVATDGVETHVVYRRLAGTVEPVGGMGAAAIRMVLKAAACSEGTPANLNAAVANTSVTLTWDYAGTPFGYSVTVQAGTHTRNVLTTARSCTIDDLLPNTAYTWSVRAMCDGQQGGTPAYGATEFTTSTPPCYTPLPWSEDFTDTQFPPDCWTTNRVMGTGSTAWARYSTSSTSSTSYHSSPASARRQNSATSAGYQDDWLITRPLAIPATGAQVSFWWRMASTSYYEKSSVLFSTTGTDVADFTELWVAPAAATTWTETVIALPPGAANQTVYIAFRYEGSTMYSFFVDDVSVVPLPEYDAALLTIVRPSGVVRSAAEEVTVVVKNVGGFPLSDIPVSYQIDGLPPVNEIIPVSGLISGSTYQYTFTQRADLSDGHAHTITASVAAPNDANTGDNTQTKNIPAHCAPVTSFPWSEGFDYQSPFPPDCWTKRALRGAASWTGSTSTSASSYHNARGAAYRAYSISSYGFQDDWLITKPIVLPEAGVYILSFWWRTSSSTYSDSKNSVLLSSSGLETDDFTEVWATRSASTVFTEQTISLAAYAGDTVYVAFRYEGTAAHNLLIDDVAVMLSTEPPQPALDASVVRLERPTGTSHPLPETVEMTIQNNGTQPINSLQIGYLLNADPPVIETVDIPSGLASGATYLCAFSTPVDLSAAGTHTLRVFTVLTNDENTANDTLPAQIVTCAVRTLPFTEDFGMYAPPPPFPPACWEITSGGTWTTGTGGAGGALTRAARRTYSSAASVTTPDDLIMPLIALPATEAYELSFYTKDYRSGGYYANGRSSVGVLTLDNTYRELWSPATLTTTWVNVRINMLDYVGDSVRIVFRYEGLNAHTWQVDDISFELLPPVSVALLSIDSPAVQGSGLSTAEPVTVTLRNIGADTLTSVEVTLTVDGVPQTETVPVHIAPGATGQYTLTLTADLSAIGTHSIQVTVTAAGDANLSDNTQSISVRHCARAIAPWTETFNSAALPDCWTALSSSGSVVWTTATGADAHSTPRAAWHNYNEEEEEDDWLITPQTLMPASGNYELSFWSRNQSSTDLGSNSVWVSTTGTDIADFEMIWSATRYNLPTSWTETRVDLSAYTGDTIFIAFRYRGGNAHTWALDDVAIQEVVDIDLAVTNVAIRTGAELSATEPVNITLHNNGIEVTTGINLICEINCATYTAFIPGPLAALSDTTVSIPANLSLPVVYNMKVYIELPGDINPANDTLYTSIATARDAHYFWNFNDGRIPDNFTLLRLDNGAVTLNDVNTWAQMAGLDPMSALILAAYVAPAAIANEAWDAVNISAAQQHAAFSLSMFSTEPANRWMITPAIEAQQSMKLSWKAWSAIGTDGYEVRLSTTGLNPDDFTVTLFSTPAESSSVTSHEVNLNEYAGHTIYIAFVQNTNAGAFLFIDDILIDGTNDVVCSGGTFTYTPAIVEGSSFTWSRAAHPDINNGTAASGAGPINEILVNHSVNDVTVVYSGLYQLADGCTGAMTISVLVTGIPELTSPVVIESVCSDFIIHYTPNSGTPDVLFNWRRLPATGILDANGQTSSAGVGDIYEILENNLNVPVTVTYRYTLNSQGCTNTQDIRVTVNPRPTKPNVWTTDGRLAFCAGDSLTLQAESIGAAHYRWVLDETLTP
ncbi:MAG: choice-of-anchor J domain-containing protein, partial [Prevotellaceae bacterium]|nr:choice-of-anchor J domain-containing protein [Prevotellaceae bacterium]